LRVECVCSPFALACLKTGENLFVGASNVHPVADSFDAFFFSLKLDEEEDEEVEEE